MRPSSQTCCASGSEGLEKLPPPQGFGRGGHHSPQPVRVRGMGRRHRDQLKGQEELEDECLTAHGWGAGRLENQGRPSSALPLVCSQPSKAGLWAASGPQRQLVCNPCAGHLDS